MLRPKRDPVGVGGLKGQERGQCCGQRCRSHEQRKKMEAVGHVGKMMPQVSGEAGRGTVSSPGATVLRTADKGEVPKEPILYPED